MNLSSELRSQFVVNILFGDPNSGSAARTFLSLASYDVFHFLDEELLISRLSESPPHVLIFESGGLTSEVNDFIARVAQINPEVLVLAVVTLDQLTVSLQNKWNIHDSLIRTKGHFEELLLRRLDHICSTLFLEYQNEELISENKSLQHRVAEPPPPVPDEAPESAPPAVAEFSLDRELQILKSASTVENLFEKGIHLLGQMSDFQFHVAFLRYVGVSNHFTPLFFSDQKDQERFRWTPDFAAFDQFRTSGTTRGLPVAEIVSDPCLCFPLEAAEPGVPYGFFLLWGAPDCLPKARALLQLFELIFRALILNEQAASLKVIDQLTGLYLGRELLPYLEAEVSRVKRTKSAVSLMKVSFDHLGEITQSFGDAQKNILIKNFAELLKTTGRLHDRIFRTGENEFSLALPDCVHQGAAIRAERLRQLVETSSFRMNGIQASISCGVSEYPHFTLSASRLIESAQEALEFIQSRGGNKVCLYRPKDDFRPEYVVEEGP